MILLDSSMNDIYSTLNQSLSQYAEGPAIDNVVTQILNKTLNLGMLLGICFYLIMLGFNYLKSGIDRVSNPNASFFIDLNELTRSLGILTLIGMYAIVMTVVVGFVNVSFKLTKMSQDDYTKLVAQTTAINQKYAREITLPVYNKALDKVAACAKGKGSTYDCAYWQQVKSDWEQAGAKNTTESIPPITPNIITKEKETPPVSEGIITSAIVAGVEEIVGQLMAFLVGACKTVIYAITKIWLKILYVTGPLALAFSILPFFRKQGEIWFGYFLNTCFVFVTFNILDCIFYGFMAVSRTTSYTGYTVNANTASQNISIMTYYFVLLIAYLSAFRITSYYVGKGEAGRAVGKAVGLVADAAKLAFAPMMLSKGGGDIAGKIVSEMAKNSSGGIKGKE